MTEPAKKLLHDALNLKPKERLMLADEILQSLDQSSEEVDTAWAKEAESRLEGYLEGKIMAIPAEEIFSENWK